METVIASTAIAVALMMGLSALAVGIGMGLLGGALPGVGYEAGEGEIVLKRASSCSSWPSVLMLPSTAFDMRAPR